MSSPSSMVRLTGVSKPYDVIHHETVTDIPPGARTVLFRFLVHNTNPDAGRASGFYSLRMEVNHRPDGVRPHGAPTYCEYLRAHVARQSDGYQLTAEECGEVAGCGRFTCAAFAIGDRDNCCHRKPSGAGASPGRPE